MNMWMRKGYTQGVLESRQELVLMLLREKFGRLNKPLKDRVAQLSSKQLAALSKALLTLNNKMELDSWLQKYAPAQVANQETN